MSYTSREQSEHDGHPLELYRFTLGDRLWLYTSAAHEEAYGEDRYQPAFIRRGGFTRGGDAAKSSMEIEVAAGNPVAALFRTGWLSGLLIVTIFRHHYEDSEFSVLWKGRVTGCKWSGSVAKLTSDSVFTMFKRAGLRRVYQVGCPHALFGPGCRLDVAAWENIAPVVDVVGNVVTLTGVAGFGPGYFIGGMLKFGEDYRMIIDQNDNSLTLLDIISSLAPGDSASIYPGCSRTMAACLNKFNNLDNYGGLPFLPSKNPFSGDALI